MSGNVDSVDKEYFQKSLEKIESHQEKTCDELTELKEGFIQLKSMVQNHLSSLDKKENRKWKIISAGLAVFAISIAFLSFILK